MTFSASTLQEGIRPPAGQPLSHLTLVACCLKRSCGMHFEAMKWAWNQPVKGNRLLILLALARRANSAWTCFPSITQIVEDTGLDIKTVKIALKHLKKLELIEDTGKRKGKTQQVIVYRIVKRSRNGLVKGGQKRDSLKNKRSPKTDSLKGSVFCPLKGVQKRTTEDTNIYIADFQSAKNGRKEPCHGEEISGGDA
jgi:DNA-binding transcriptional ArsR family regulator